MIPDQVRIKDIKPALSGYITQSLRLLKRSSVPDDDAVHDIRVLMKKARATMKLLTPQIDEKTFEREYNSFKEAGLLLASLRETSVHRKTLKSIRKSHRGLFSRLETNEKIRNILKKESDIILSEEQKKRLLHLEEILVKSLYRIRFLQMNSLNHYLLLSELEKMFNNVSGLYLKCRHNPKPALLHRFRKRSKDLLYGFYYFRPLNAPVVRRQEKRLDNLTQYLGKYNDLAQLTKTLNCTLDNPENSPDINELLVIIKDLQHEYLSKVWSSAYRLFCPGQKMMNLIGYKLLPGESMPLIKIR